MNIYFEKEFMLVSFRKRQKYIVWSHSNLANKLLFLFAAICTINLFVTETHVVVVGNSSTQQIGGAWSNTSILLLIFICCFYLQNNWEYFKHLRKLIGINAIQFIEFNENGIRYGWKELWEIKSSWVTVTRYNLNSSGTISFRISGKRIIINRNYFTENQIEEIKIYLESNEIGIKKG
jgi:hypothetical protein